MDIRLFFQDGWHALQHMPEDPECSFPYGKQTSSSVCYALLFPVEAPQAMPFDDKQSIIDGIHQALADNQALIEVENGRNATKNGENISYVYSIIKTLREHSFVQYFMRANIKDSDGLFEVHALFNPMGDTGIRDATIFELMSQQGMDEDDWMRDPYDNSMRRPFLMNLSEQRQYDKRFPDHPLSQARHLVEILTHEYTGNWPEKAHSPRIENVDKHLQLVKDFIKEYLNGDINQLAKYDLRQLEGKERYADEAGHAHDVCRTELVRAIAALVFKDIAPKDVLFDKKSGKLKLMPAPLLKEDLWGIQVGSRFAILSQFRLADEAEISRRIVPCAKLCNTIGNLYIHPASLEEYRHSHAHGRFLIDYTFADLHKALTGGKPSQQMKKAVSGAKDFFDLYRGDDGWKKLMEKWMTMDLVDYYYNPEPFFEEVTLTTYMPAGIYLRAVNRCIDTCYEIIPRRAEWMVERLRKAIYE